MTDLKKKMADWHNRPNNAADEIVRFLVPVNMNFNGVAEFASDKIEEVLERVTEAARAAGRIEGLQEAEELCRLVRDGLTVTTPDTHEVWCAIRARIQELEGEK